MKLLVLMLLSGCANQWMPMDCEQSDSVAQTTLRWVRVKSLLAECAKVGAKTLERGGACISCSPAVEGGTLCTMWAEDPRTVDEMTLGHEVRHAFGCVHG